VIDVFDGHCSGGQIFDKSRKAARYFLLGIQRDDLSLYQVDPQNLPDGRAAD
jgi:hypothetical protein